MKRADLHMHSWVSDGDVAPAEVVRLAVAARLDVIALTDHDTAAGVEEALEASRSENIEVIPGIEISTRCSGRELHILGYWIDPGSEPILEHQRKAVKRRRDRMEGMVELLRGMDVTISMDNVEKAAGDSAKVLGRPHLARALFEAGVTRYYAEAFDRYIGDDGPAYVSEGFPDPQYAIDTIHEAGGSAVWAHPPVDWYPEGIGMLAGWGLDGVECYRPSTLADDVAMLEEGARSHGLFMTGGSDWHGPKRSTLGDFAILADRLSSILELGGVTP